MSEMTFSRFPKTEETFQISKFETALKVIRNEDICLYLHQYIVATHGGVGECRDWVLYEYLVL